MVTSQSNVVRVHLLGSARLSGSVTVARLEKKSAALLGILAVDGPTTRTRVAGMLWPESREATARNNLAQAVRRLRQLAGTALVTGDDTIAIAEATVDVGELLAAATRGDHAAVAALDGELLGGIDLDDCPELEAWLRGARQRVKSAWLRSTSIERDRAETARELDRALALAEKMVTADPISEAVYLSVARIHLAKGDTAAAMATCERCRKVLARELAIKPSQAMHDLLRTIREGRARPPAPSTLSPRVLRPRWIGRRREWEAITRAADAGKLVVVSAEPGFGKSRLVREHAEARGRVLLFEGRPGDSDVPYATLARGLRALVARKIALPAWVRTEIARIVPEAADDEPPQSIHHKIRFFEGIARALAEAGGNDHVLVLDDLQWFDGASIEVLFFVAERAGASGSPPPTLAAHRAGELVGDVARAIDDRVRADRAVALPLGPLSDDDVRELVVSLEVGAASDRVDEIVRMCRGVPLYALEIARELCEVGAGAPIAERVRALLQKRLARLDEAALRVARVASLAGTAFDLALAAAVLETPALDLAEPLAALERADVVVDGRFTHDLLAEAAQGDLAGPVKEHLHDRIAAHLVAHASDPARIARHLEAAGRAADAAPYLVRAADAARDLSRVEDAIAMYDRAARALEMAGDLPGASVALYMRARSHMGAEAADVLARIDHLARTEADRARAACIRANVALEHGDLAEARIVAARALAFARSAHEPMVEAEAIQVELEITLRDGHVEEARVALDAFAEVTHRAFAGDREAVASVRFYEGELAAASNHHADAIAIHEATIADLRAWGRHRHSQGGIHASIAFSALEMGDALRADAAIADATACLTDAPGAQRAHAALALARAMRAIGRGELDEAIRATAPIAGEAFEVRDVLAARALEAEVGVRRGDDEAARRVAALEADPRCDARTRARLRARAR